MGMFDYIKAPAMNCPNCGEYLNNFQSKDGSCELKTLDYWEVDNFYDYCDNCETMTEFQRKVPRQYAPFTDYEMISPEVEDGK